MKTLFANMANDPNSRIVLNGCLTASQQVSGPLDPDPNKAAAQVAAAVKARRAWSTTCRTPRRHREATPQSWAPTLRRPGGAAGRIRQPGHRRQGWRRSPTDRPEAGLHSRRHGAARRPPGGAGGVGAGSNRGAADPYGCRHGAHQGHHRASVRGVESAGDPDPARRRRRAIDNAEQTRSMAGAADVLGGMSEGSFSVSKLGSGVPHGQMATIFGAMRGASSFAAAAFSLTIYQAGMQVDNAKQADFMAALDPDPLTDARSTSISWRSPRRWRPCCRSPMPRTRPRPS